jgi:bifunctional DNA-binding transcriptional regulator/antitoxin component of YhaV-PrlF toxin-antitoxin module
VAAITMKLSRNGQVSLPADVRRRWGTDRVLVLDLGDYVVMRPVSTDRAENVRAVLGRYASPDAPSTEELRRQAREEEVEIEDRKERL